ncbi:MAG: hypothetical protein ACR2OB_01880 [Solirubrobacteraceae bacterium]
MRLRPSRLAFVVVLVAALAPAGPAGALEPGVFFDPNSPAGKQYAFPLDVLRGAAVGRSAPQGVTQPLFGVGIAPAAASRLRSAASSGGSSAGSVTAAGSRLGVTSHLARTSNAALGRGAQAGQAGAPAGRIPALASLVRPASTALQVALIAVAVLLGGLALGVILTTVRRRRDQ